MMTGLKRGTVKLIPHQEEWDQNAKEMIGILFELLNDAAIDIQHVGSTAIQSILLSGKLNDVPSGRLFRADLGFLQMCQSL